MALDLEKIEVSAGTDAPNTGIFTTNSVDGVGVFDVFMKAAKSHLAEEYDAGRITGQEYSVVYLGLVQSVMQQSNAYISNLQSEKKSAAEIGLVRQKIVTELANTDNDLPGGLAFNGTTAIEGLVSDQRDLNAQQILLATSKVATENTQKALTGQQIISELARTGDNFTTALLDYGFNTSSTAEGAMTAVAAKAQSEADLVTQKLVTELGQTSSVKPTDLGLDPATSIDGLVGAQFTLVTNQGNKASKEIVLLAQKTITELAQTSEAVVTSTDALNTSTVVGGVSGKQQVLYTRQADGFLRDAEQKLTRMAIDAWGIDATTGDATANATNKLQDSDLGAMITKAYAGVGVVV